MNPKRLPNSSNTTFVSIGVNIADVAVDISRQKHVQDVVAVVESGDVKWVETVLVSRVGIGPEGQEQLAHAQRNAVICKDNEINS